MIERIEVKGKLIHECSIPGEQRKDNIYPGHANGCQVAEDRWLVIYATRGWRNVDDDRSIIYQLRVDKPDGSILKEGYLRQYTKEWDRDGDGKKYIMQLGHPEVWGVPKGAVINGKPALNANIFVARWRQNDYGIWNPETGKVEKLENSQCSVSRVEEIQFQLNVAKDDIEILSPPQQAAEKGFEAGPNFSRRDRTRYMNRNITQMIPFNDDATEWVGVDSFLGQVAALKYRFNSAIRLYEWVDTGPLIQSPGWSQGEASIIKNNDEWCIITRAADKNRTSANGWVKTRDPFGKMDPPVMEFEGINRIPFTMYRCPDNVVRRFSGSYQISPYDNPRNPLFCWKVDPETRKSSECRLVYDCIERGIFPKETDPKSEMCKLLPHGGGRVQYLLWRVRAKNVDVVHDGLPPITDDLKPPHGIYYAEVHYTKDLPGVWEFE